MHETHSRYTEVKRNNMNAHSDGIEVYNESRGQVHRQSRGLVVIGGDSCARGREFESPQLHTKWIIFTFIC